MNHKITDPYHLELLEKIREHSDQGTDKRKGQAGKDYVGTRKIYYGIKASVKEKIVRDWIKKHPKLSISEYTRLLSSLFKGRSHEEISVGGKLIKFLPKLRRQLTMPVRQSTDPRFSKLSFKIIDKLKGENHPLVTKAISWLLRDLIKNHRREVERYLGENQDILPKIAVRETRRKLLTGRDCMKIVFVHYRTGERDGVSLEIEKRAQILQQLGDEVFFITGFDGLARKNAYIIKELDIKTSYNKFLREDCFYTGLFEEDFMLSLFFQLEYKIYRKLDKAFNKINPKIVFVHNLFSHAYNLPATTALLKILDKYQTKTVAVNHDFWFERPRLQKPKYYFIKELLYSLPPTRPYIIRHQVINKLAQKEVLKRRGIEAECLGDYFEYRRSLAKIDRFNRDLPEYFKIDKNDFLILHATRITARKNIENAFLFARELEKTLRNRAPIKILSKTFKRTSRVIVFLPNFVEVDALDYYKRLKKLGEKLKLNVIFAWEKFLPERKQENGVKTYSFWDAYPFADLITYTSSWEGFGNQFLEAVHFKKLPVVFEYPVFAADIRKEGYQYISLGDKLRKRNGFGLVPKEKIKKAVEQTIDLLQQPEKIKKIVEKNFSIARKNHSLDKLKNELKRLLSKV